MKEVKSLYTGKPHAKHKNTEFHSTRGVISFSTKLQPHFNKSAPKHCLVSIRASKQITPTVMKGRNSL